MAYEVVPDDVTYIRKFSGVCDAEVSRRGESQPCGKPAVAVAVGAEEGGWWPVCSHHSRGRAMVPLTELIKALDESSWKHVSLPQNSLQHHTHGEAQ